MYEYFANLKMFLEPCWRRIRSSRTLRCFYCYWNFGRVWCLQF